MSYAIKTLSIIIPVFNEERTIELILQRVTKVQLKGGYTKEIILVNDCSTDESLSLIRTIQKTYPEGLITIANQDVNQGKGAAIARGIGISKGDYIIIQDADLEYDPQDYNALLATAIIDDLDAVYGSRFINDDFGKSITSWHTLVNRCLTALSNLFTGLDLTDMETCYKMIKGEILRRFELNEKRFGIEPEITSKLGKIQDLKIAEVPISYDRRSYKEGKKIGWKDGVRAIYCILKYR